MNRIIGISLVCMLILSCGHVYAASENHTERDENRIVTLSNVIYDYTMSYYDGRPDCHGDVSFDITFPSGASRIIVAKTRAHLLTYDNPFYSGRIFIEVDELADNEHVVIHDISWGTFISAQIIYKDSYNPLSPYINTSDYISEEDKNIIFSSLDSSPINDDDHSVRIAPDGTIIIDSVDRGTLWLYDINGKCVLVDSFQDSAIIPLPVSSSSLYILKVKLNNRIITRKISRLL